VSHTGTYVLRGKKLIKISDRVKGPLTFSDVTFKQPFITTDLTGYPIEVKSARHKKRLMEMFNVREPVDSKDVAKNTSNRLKFKPTNKREFVANHLKRLGVTKSKLRIKMYNRPLEDVRDPIDRKVLKGALSHT